MSGLDLFAWLVLLIIVVASIIVALFLASLPGRIARRRNHPWANGVSVAGWIFFFVGFALWPVALVWAYVDAPARSEKEIAR